MSTTPLPPRREQRVRARRRRAWAWAGLGAGAGAVAVIVGLDAAQPSPANGPVGEASTAHPSTSPSQTPSPPEPDVLDGIALDPLQERQIDSLRDFAAWLDDNDAEGFVGEVGWPAATDPAWDDLGRAWYLVAEQEGLWTAAWAAGTAWPDDYELVVYGDSGTGSLNAASGHGRVIEDVEQDAAVVVDSSARGRHGVNVAGLEFGTGEGYSSASPGSLGTDYFAEPVESYAWLAGRGIDLVRLPVAWERLQPSPGGQFDAAYSAVVSDQLDAAAAAGIDVILDLHNYGRYAAPEGSLLLGSTLDGDRLTDVWMRIGEEWGQHRALLGYGLMNEPHDLVGGDVAQGALLWERLTQDTVSALRAAGDDHLLLVAGYDWSSLVRWRDTHADAWIEDPADNVRYEAHHYWDGHGAGAYPLSYADELEAAAR